MKRGGYLKRSTRSPLRYRRHPAGTHKGMVEELDRLSSLIVRKRDGCCITCGSSHELTASHFYRRTYLIIRFDLRNLACQCFNCNKVHSINPWPYVQWFLNTYSDDVMTELHELRMSTKRLTDADLAALITERRQQLKEMRWEQEQTSI